MRYSIPCPSRQARPRSSQSPCPVRCPQDSDIRAPRVFNFRNSRNIFCPRVLDPNLVVKIRMQRNVHGLIYRAANYSSAVSDKIPAGRCRLRQSSREMASSSGSCEFRLQRCQPCRTTHVIKRFRGHPPPHLTIGNQLWINLLFQ